MATRTGGCLCGRVRWAYEGPENWRAHCHCTSCRRNTASPFTTFMGVPYARFRFAGAVPETYVSSPGVRRRFCATCGTPVAYEADRYPEEIHLYAASLDDVADFQPQFHVHVAEAVPWVELADKLKRFAHNG